MKLTRDKAVHDEEGHKTRDGVGGVGVLAYEVEVVKLG